MSAYYNEIDPYAAQWLRNLIAAGHIAPGDVDERSIVDVRPGDLRGYTQCHFFAGIGIWSHALRRAGWADDRPVWTGSCPCQPFSVAGQSAEFDDARHLWPAWNGLIREHRPVVVFGEQVASKDALAWLDVVCADLESQGYTVGAIDTCSAGVGAPHIRQRLHFVADAQSRGPGVNGSPSRQPGHPDLGDEDGGLAHTECDRRQPRRGDQRSEDGARREHGNDTLRRSQLGNALEPGLEGHPGDGDHRHGPGWLDAIEARPAAQAGTDGDDGLVHPAGLGREMALFPTGSGTAPAGEREADERGGRGPVNGFWADADWIPCRDGKARPVEPGTFPLAHGATSRVGRLRAYGNGINPEVAAHFIAAYLEVRTQ